MRLELSLPAYYRFEAMIDAHGWPQLAPFSWNAEARLLDRTEQLSTRIVVLLRIESLDRSVVVEVEGPPLTARERGEVERSVRWMLELDEDLSEFYAFCAEHAGLRHIPSRGLGPLLRSPTVWEDYVKTVCTTNTTWGQTKAMVSRLVDAFGAPFQAGVSNAFPSPETIAGTSAEEFAAAVRAGYRAPYLYTTAVEIAEGKLDLERFKERAHEVETPALMAELRKLRGVGPYAAAHLALLLGSYGYVPVDSWARELVRRHIMSGTPVTDRDVHRHFDHFGRWKALAYWHWDWEGAATTDS